MNCDIITFSNVFFTRTMKKMVSNLIWAMILKCTVMINRNSVPFGCSVAVTAVFRE